MRVRLRLPARRHPTAALDRVKRLVVHMDVVSHHARRWSPIRMELQDSFARGLRGMSSHLSPPRRSRDEVIAPDVSTIMSSYTCQTGGAPIRPVWALSDSRVR